MSTPTTSVATAHPLKLKGYKWIKPYVESLDPDIDFEEMIRTTAQYTTNEFVMDISYVANFIGVIMEPKGSEALNSTGKVFNHMQERFEDSVIHFIPWFIDGPTSDNVKKHIELLNKTHMLVARRVPGNFDHDVDFIMPCVQMGVYGHDFQRTIGLPGFSPNMQRAYYHWTYALFRNFRKESGPLKGYPKDWDGMVAFSEWWFKRDFVSTQRGHDVSVALVQQFCDRFFPKPLHFLGYEIILTFLTDSAIEVHRLGPRKLWLESLIKAGFRIMLTVQSLLPDSKVPTMPTKESLAAYRKMRRNTGSSPLLIAVGLVVVLVLVRPMLYSFKGV
ncbi:hypothetical protein IFR04_016173 [Cadophora malorum]|uniref:ER-bound oxygenase mpaB/mpaB'/Rubber oxygenase catalytic domain-containing protein n=1 Tax=Cadophora malorum TaxID=108018 RepID=A0A8H7T1F1_9HELO|nr:hypothetical protein IFR04_016173 [Cadophora malorum]